MLIFLDGIDKSGKTTLKEAIHRATNYQHVIEDRGFASNFVYGKLRKRKINYKELLECEKELSKNKCVKQIFVIANKEDIIKRFKKHNEKDLKLNEIQRVLNLYEEYFKKTKIHTLVVNTSNGTIDECVELIKRWLGEK